jgi:hypothetical protein
MPKAQVCIYLLPDLKAEFDAHLDWLRSFSPVPVRPSTVAAILLGEALARCRKKRERLLAQKAPRARRAATSKIA